MKTNNATVINAGKLNGLSEHKRICQALETVYTSITPDKTVTDTYAVGSAAQILEAYRRDASQPMTWINTRLAERFGKGKASASFGEVLNGVEGAKRSVTNLTPYLTVNINGVTTLAYRDGARRVQLSDGSFDAGDPNQSSLHLICSHRHGARRGESGVTGSKQLVRKPGTGHVSGGDATRAMRDTVSETGRYLTSVIVRFTDRVNATHAGLEEWLGELGAALKLAENETVQTLALVTSTKSALDTLSEHQDTNTVNRLAYEQACKVHASSVRAVRQLEERISFLSETFAPVTGYLKDDGDKRKSETGKASKTKRSRAKAPQATA